MKSAHIHIVHTAYNRINLLRAAIPSITIRLAIKTMHPKRKSIAIFPASNDGSNTSIIRAPSRLKPKITTATPNNEQHLGCFFINTQESTS